MRPLRVRKIHPAAAAENGAGAPWTAHRGDFFEGVPLEQVEQRKQAGEIGFVLQSPEDQVVTDQVWHELAFGLESLGFDQAIIRRRVAEMASFFGMEDWFYRDVAQLSGGQKQLLNLASVMVMQPKALILDEPTSQLDPIAASDFWPPWERSTENWGRPFCSPSTGWKRRSLWHPQ